MEASVLTYKKLGFVPGFYKLKGYTEFNAKRISTIAISEKKMSKNDKMEIKKE